MTITPTIGRIVWFKSKVGDIVKDEAPAIVTRVFSDTCVNLTVFQDGGQPINASSVVMTEDFEASGQHNGWRWMPYQREQAAKHAAEDASA